MPLTGPLFERVANAPQVTAGLPLIVALTGFPDAGSAVAGLVEFVADRLEPQPVVVFINDVLLDYRARRPIVAFDKDHLTDYRAPRLELSLAHDALGRPFLVLAGYEPDFAWDSFVAVVAGLVSELAVSTITWVHAIPMPVPHTRPVGTTVSGTRMELTAAHSIWQPQTEVPATVGHLLEYRLAEAGAQVAGFVLLVPHYLGDTEYPGATVAALEKLSVATGLMFPLDELREADGEFVARIEEQVHGSDELTRMLAGLEERYDAYMAGNAATAPTIDEQLLPSADELAAELERYLASRQPGEDDKRGGLRG